ncbi:bifunctional diguanylate cyclase/phosphodiesterase [Plantactinospora sp. KBS50]|uniref:putative bifunctional diguanylate cyclase/phosphodiesterase n=1 Tax=Plantactinospora sp. KBS50 TaxID=2024580 RepID=UPI000BAAE343|nr:bifunctional diguanylate cyclase/phosphodiesterase [Plantactinospora sp. KBS50]ASW53513.1 diguanylate cyclase [Plantactinospora sp. KBS50]
MRSRKLPGRNSERAWLITGPLAALAVLSCVLLGVLGSNRSGWWNDAAPFARMVLFVALLAALVLASIPTLQLVVRRQGMTVSITEIPIVLALHYLPPLLVVLLVTFATLMIQVRRRMSRVKLWFNVANSAAAISLASLVLAQLPADAGVGPVTWAVLCVALAVYTLVTVSAVSGVIGLLQGWQAGREVLGTARLVLVTLGLNTAVGLVILLALDATWWSLLPLTALAAALALVYRSYATSLRQHRMLEDMYELTRAMTESGQDGTLPDAMLGRVRALMQAEYATLWLPAQGRHPEVLLSARVDDSGLLDVAPIPAAVRKRAIQERRTLAIGSRLEGGDRLRTMLHGTDVKDALVVPLRSGSAMIGTLEVVNRLSDVGHFRPGDVPVFETVAAHTAVALENSRLVDRLRFDAYHDGLTKLPNRRRMTAALGEAVQIRAPDEVVAILLFDVDDLRRVNETLGHAAGDQVLVEVAERLRRSAPSSSLIGRIGGDEFVVLLRLDDADAALDLAARLREQIRDKMVFGELTLDVDTVVGVALHPDHGGDAHTLLQRVDLAATAAKAVPGGIQLFSPMLESRSLHRLSLATDLRRALDQGELEVYFQPKVTLHDRRLVGVECLARWEHPAHGAVAPEDFVAVAEHTGQLGRLTEVVLREGLRRSRDWPDQQQPLNIAVNLSARSLADPHFPALVDGLLAEYGVPAERLTLEIRESGVLDGTDRPVPILRRLREIGVRLSVDDFGTGYASLLYLRRLPVHEVKVDRSFVQGMATDPVDLAIVNAVVTLSQQFGLAVVAEGVESELTLELLQDIGCQIAQGFLFSRPLPYERLAAWVDAQSEPEPLTAADVRRLRAVP